MKFYAGIALPDHETHLVEWMRIANRIVDGKPTYQFHKLEAALAYVRDFRVAVDVGAHAGLWSMHLVKRFARVEAFEPVAAHRACFKHNVTLGEYHLHPFVLGAAPGAVALTTRETSSGDTYVSGPGDLEMRTLDSYGFSCVDFLKIDCEGYELEVLKGAVNTLERCRPVVIVEQKAKNLERNFGATGRPAVDFLTDRGARVRREMGGDYILTWE